MNRSKWLQKTRTMAERLYDHGAPAYWVKFGKSIAPTHHQFMQMFLGLLPAHAAILDAACGAGLYDGMLIEAGHTVLGIDQSAGMLAQAREHYPQEQFPRLRYEKIRMQELDFTAAFDGLICMDAMEHICPEDWPVILERFNLVLKTGGVLYVTVDYLDHALNENRQSYERARAMGLPVVFGEQVDELEDAFTEAMGQDLRDPGAISGDRLDHSVYHFHPSLAQVRTWLSQAGFRLEQEAATDDYAHFLVRKGD